MSESASPEDSTASWDSEMEQPEHSVFFGNPPAVSISLVTPYDELHDEVASFDELLGSSWELTSQSSSTVPETPPPSQTSTVPGMSRVVETPPVSQTSTIAADAGSCPSVGDSQPSVDFLQDLCSLPSMDQDLRLDSDTESDHAVCSTPESDDFALGEAQHAGGDLPVPHLYFDDTSDSEA